ncbi:DUF4148 domain-containing protein [Undibacterium sp. TJN25]|uniref:DUF4148 domain-containing protein n=1 Tax=Undibacterium sp. TJN25 TaxID=3413056 RepID=UPI003BF24EB9
MNAKKIFVLLAMAAASSVTFAQDVQGDSAAVGKTRQQVINELNDARAQGLLNFSDADYPVLPAATSTLTRAQVVAGIQEARKDGTLFSDYDYDYPRAQPVVASAEKTRAEVKAGITMARADGTLFAPDWDYPVTHPKMSTHIAAASHTATNGNS